MTNNNPICFPTDVCFRVKSLDWLLDREVERAEIAEAEVLRLNSKIRYWIATLDLPEWAKEDMKAQIGEIK